VRPPRKALETGSFCCLTCIGDRRGCCHRGRRGLRRGAILRLLQSLPNSPIETPISQLERRSSSWARPCRQSSSSSTRTATRGDAGLVGVVRPSGQALPEGLRLPMAAALSRKRDVPVNEAEHRAKTSHVCIERTTGTPRRGPPGSLKTAEVQGGPRSRNRAPPGAGAAVGDGRDARRLGSQDSPTQMTAIVIPSAGQACPEVRLRGG